MVRSNGSNVRGPNSALTEFLRSRGIRIQNNRGRATPPETPTDESTPVEASAVSEQEQLDAAVAEELTAVLEQEKPKRATKASAAKSKKRKKGEEDEAYDPEDEPDYGRSGFSRKSRPAAGQIEFCAECNCRFTVTVYNKATDEGLLCSACGSADTPGKVVAKAKPRPATKKKRAKAVLDGDTDKVPKLQDLTIKCIARHIEDIEMLGDIGHVNMDKICQIISRNRSLTNETIQLFLDASLKNLSLYDCAKINPQRLTQVAHMCPHLEHLRLHMVGQITDPVLMTYAKLANLRSLSLRGCFLITVSGWSTFFETVASRLQHLEISDSSRFKAETAAALVKHCPNISELTLSKLTHLDDPGILHLASLSHLTALDISHAGANVSDETIITLLQHVGGSLESLNISGLRELTDATLTDGILKYCTRLQHLYLNELDLLTDDGVASLFNGWSGNSPLLTVELERCPLVHDKGVAAILAHSGANLRRINLNSLDELTHEGILRISESNVIPQCEVLDVSWIRAVDDLVLRRLLANAKALKKLLVWGNNRVTECESSATCLIVGRETG
ncbi:protein of unknown function [Taphrina deformans PYCC 5710]|uniref:RNI-like protein n=1 Tax=Taphrina deformans (strain PYCC 5710 / ATCC 11124 / CBS 356.35 / IMI 108563 / JCM 9778 / NBRC 8474) TaxID=1097556 RepID=R4XD03_TAPDE|nr:protein of unknown function [Taphrina deformans PYCC 5710]|eukprot:CCG83689.1 protein of unknown function [Taphrina deformans PYCC 5710]